MCRQKTQTKFAIKSLHKVLSKIKDEQPESSSKADWKPDKDMVRYVEPLLGETQTVVCNYCYEGDITLGELLEHFTQKCP